MKVYGRGWHNGDVGDAWFEIDGTRNQLLKKRGINVCLVSLTDFSVIDLFVCDTWKDDSHRIMRYTSENLRSYAESGDAYAQMLLSEFLSTSEDKLDEAIFWMKKSADQMSEANNKLFKLVKKRYVSDGKMLDTLSNFPQKDMYVERARLYADGIVLGQNDDLAIYLFKRSNSPAVDKDLAALLMRSSLTEHHNEAFSILEKHKDDPSYSVLRARAYRDGIGVRTSNNLAIKEFERRLESSYFPLNEYISLLLVDGRKNYDDMMTVCDVFESKRSNMIKKTEQIPVISNITKSKIFPMVLHCASIG